MIDKLVYITHLLTDLLHSNRSCLIYDPCKASFGDFQLQKNEASMDDRMTYNFTTVSFTLEDCWKSKSFISVWRRKKHTAVTLPSLYVLFPGLAWCLHSTLHMRASTCQVLASLQRRVTEDWLGGVAWPF